MREQIRRLLRQVIVFALDGPPALLAELIEMKNEVDRAIDRLRSDIGDDFAEANHDHDGVYLRDADIAVSIRAQEEMALRLRVVEDRIGIVSARTTTGGTA